MRYVAVKHNLYSDKLYWFYVPECFDRFDLSEENFVACRTSRGITAGYILTQLDSSFRRTNDAIAGELAGAELKPIVGVASSINRSDLIIPPSFIRTKPSPEKLTRKIAKYQENRGLSPIIVDVESKILLDGYMSYLILKMFTDRDMINVVYTTKKLWRNK